MKGKVREDYNVSLNDHSYTKDQIVEVTELPNFETAYAIYTKGNVDWIPKALIQLL